MDTLSRKILTAGQKVIAELRRLGPALLGIEKQIESIAEHNQAQYQREKTPPILRAEFQIPEAIKGDWKRENTKKNRREWFAIGVSALTLFAVIAYAIINYHMLYEMRRTAKTSEDALRQANENNATSIAAQQKIAQDSLTASQQSFEKSLRATIQQFRLEQRAWVGPVAAILPNIKQKSTDHFGIWVANTGKTPAKHLVSGITTQYLPASAAFVPFFKNVSPTTPASVLQPNMKLKLLSLAYPAIISDRERENLISGTDIFYMYGKIVYQDVFGEDHWTKFCMFLNRDLSSFAACSTYNDAN